MKTTKAINANLYKLQPFPKISEKIIFSMQGMGGWREAWPLQAPYGLDRT